MFGNHMYYLIKDYVSLIDDYSHFTQIYPMKRKAKVHELFAKFQTWLENLFNCKIKMFQSNGGGEFDNSPVLLSFDKHNIYFRKSCPNSQQQNDIVERKHLHILKILAPFLFMLMPTYFFCLCLYLYH